jgi:hypothetical protein
MQKITSWGQVPVFTALALAATCMGCSPRAHTVQHYQKDGVQFAYYSDWKVVKDAPVSGNAQARAINIDGPNHAVVVLICEPPSDAHTLAGFAAAVAEKRGAGIEAKLSVGSIKTADVSKTVSEPTSGRVAGQERPGILQHFSVDLLGVQVPHVVSFYMVPGARYKVLVMSQAAVIDSEATHPGADLILSTLAIEGSS